MDWQIKPYHHNLVIAILYTLLSFTATSQGRIYSVPLKLFNGQTDLAVGDAGYSPGPSLTTLRYPDAGGSADTDGNLAGKPGQGYYIEIAVGTPPQQMNVLVDTGSSNFAIAAAPHPDVAAWFDRDNSSTFVDLGVSVSVPYTQGDWEGVLGEDWVTMTSLGGASIKANIACITDSDNFFINGSHWQGILGMAYAEIARPDASVKPFFDSLIEQAGVTNETFSLQLCGTVDAGGEVDVSEGGTLILGGMDKSRYQGDMVWAEIHKEWYYEVVIVDIAVNGLSLGMDCMEYNFDKSIVDSGTTNLRVPNKVFDQLTRAIKSDTRLQVRPPPPGFWAGDEILCWPAGTVPWTLFPDVTLSLAMNATMVVRLHITAQQYLRSVSDEYDPERGDDCFKYAIAASDTGTVLGAVVMEGYYVVFDRLRRRIGFAQTTCPNRDASSPAGVSGPLYYNDTSSCFYVKPESEEEMLMIVAYILAAICAACMLPLCIMLTQFVLCRRRPDSSDDAPLVENVQ